MAAAGNFNLGNYEVKLTDKLGQGTFGVVYRGKHLKSKDEVAIKQLEIQSDNYGFMAMKEIKNFQQLADHPYIVKLFDFHYTKNSFWMVMEFCDAGDLGRYVKRVNPGIEPKIHIMYQSASAIAYMHTRANPVVHRDIKPANIMMKTVDDQIIVKVTDFGLSKVVEEAPDPGMTMMFSTAAGTPGFMAPEFFKKEPYTSSVDVFAMGLVFLAMLDYKPGDQDLIPLSAANRKSGMIMPVGMEMAHYATNNLPMSVLVEDCDEDSAEIKGIKSLITRMVTFDRKDRMRMKDVETELKVLGGSSRGTIAVEAKKPVHQRTNAELEKMNPKTQHSLHLSNSQNSRIDSSEQSADVGFMLLKEAIQDKMRDKLKAENKSEKDMKDVPFTSLLNRVLTDEKFKKGDRVKIVNDADELQKYQKGHGEWNDHMLEYLGHECTVLEVIYRVVKVKFDDGQLWNYNPNCLRHLNETDDEPGLKCVNNSLAGYNFDDSEMGDWLTSKFKRYEVVCMPEEEAVVRKFQRNHGGWNFRMEHVLGTKGIINRVDKDGDVFVEFINGDDWTLNPEMLESVDMSEETIAAGDFVIIYDDKEKVKKLQEDRGGWVESMTSCLGKSGIVQSVGDEKAKVETRGKTFIWNMEALVLVAKGEEMLRAVLQQKIVL